MGFNFFRKYYTDGTDLNLGVGGDKISTDDLGNGMKVQRVKVQYGDDGLATDVSAANPLPVAIQGNVTIGTEIEIKNDVGNPIPVSLPAGLATSTGQDTANTTLSTIAGKDFATQATLALIKAKTDNLDLAITGLRDALRGANSKTFTDLDTDLGALHTDLGTVHSDLITLLTTSDFDSKTGSLTETAPATDTASSGLNGRLQRIAQRITSLIALLPTALDGSGFLKTHEQGTAATSVADGSNAVEGTIADAIVAAGATGTISAKLRRVTQGLEDLKSLIVLAAGDNIIGRVKLSDGTLLLSLLNSAPVSDTGQISIPVRVISSLATSGGGTQYTEDAVSAADPIGNMTILRRRDSLVTTEVSTDGDNIAANSTNRGELYIRAADISVSGNITTPDVAGGTPDGNGTPITTTPTANSAVFAQVSGYSAFSIFLSGTLGSSTYYVEGSSNSTTGTDGSWVTISEKVEGSVTPSSGFTILASKLVRGNCAGLSYIRLRAIGGSAINSTVVIRLSIGQPGMDIIRGLPAGTNVIGGITSTDLGTSADSSATTDTGNFSQISLIKRLLTKTPALGQTTMANSQPVAIASDQGAVPITGNQSALSTTSWTSATALNTAQSISITNLNTVTVALVQGTTITGGAITFEVSPDNTNWFPIQMARIDSYTVESVYTLAASTNRGWSTSVDGFTNFRVRLSTAITGTATVTVLITAQVFAVEPIVSVGQATASNLQMTVGAALPAGSNIIGKVGIDQTTPGTTNAVAGLSTAANITATTNTTILPVLPFATWNITHLPATATKATISKGAGAAGVRHVCTGFIASLAAGATAQTPITVSIRDGATGAGTVLWSGALAAPIDGSCQICMTGLCLIGTAATAMTIEFSAAGVAASQETVSLQGFSTS